MADNGTCGRSTSKLILGGTVFVIIVLAVVLLPFMPDEPVPPPLPPPIPIAADPSNTPPPLQRFNLFFVHPDSLELIHVEEELHLHGDTLPRLKQIANALLNKSPTDLISAVPKGTFLYGVYLDDQSTAYLDFSSHLTEAHIGGTSAELLTVTAILKTIHMNFGEEIQKVQILIDGQEFDTIAGHVSISSPLALTAAE